MSALDIPDLLGEIVSWLDARGVMAALCVNRAWKAAVERIWPLENTLEMLWRLSPGFRQCIIEYYYICASPGTMAAMPWLYDAKIAAGCKDTYIGSHPATPLEMLDSIYKWYIASRYYLPAIGYAPYSIMVCSQLAHYVTYAPAPTQPDSVRVTISDNGICERYPHIRRTTIIPMRMLLRWSQRLSAIVNIEEILQVHMRAYITYSRLNGFFVDFTFLARYVPTAEETVLLILQVAELRYDKSVGIEYVLGTWPDCITPDKYPKLHGLLCCPPERKKETFDWRQLLAGPSKQWEHAVDVITDNPCAHT